MVGQPSSRMLEKRRAAWLQKLSELGPCLRGSLCTATRGNHVAHQLTVSVQSKTRTVYVPLEMVEEVKQWISNYRRGQAIMEKISVLSMSMIHRRVPESRGGGKSAGKRRPKRQSSC